MGRQQYTYLVIFCLFVAISGKNRDLFPSCEVELMVRRGTTWKTAPLQPLTVRCPVKDCGKLLNITWCKLLDTHICEPINKTENVEIRQNNHGVNNDLISYLTFKWISVHDDGLYRCDLKAHNYSLISHTINISVSDMHHGVETTDNTDNIAVASPNTAGDESMFWLPYFYICVCTALLVVTLTVLTFLSFYGWKRTLTFNPTKGLEIPTHAIPDLPKGSSPSSPVLQAHFVLNDIYSHSSSAAGTLPSPPSLITNGNQPLANTADESQVSDCAVYAVINHKRPGIPATRQHAETKQDKNPQYATVNVA
ncbi:B- and T-lymphocyte attenuator [Toxotes jaculatrix]|uniref:B- and T-lymphocyte attenuator n=1 Tax=Toxotes jaculatrix TaxID=941984 RepID=UPI001B3AF25B|nr:B- and T-lymphocyte attenuator [Toxotes jaculatrix]